MAMFIGSRGILGNPEKEIARLEALTSDLVRIAAGWRPDVEYLASAPLIDRYAVWARVSECLAGDVSDHPVLGTRKVVTSQLWAISPELGWARTYSRFYRLGAPLNARRDG
jgi:hypothetical protein